MMRIIRREGAEFTKKIVRVSGFDVVFGKKTSPGISFIGCPEGYLFFQVREKGRTGFYKG